MKGKKFFLYLVTALLFCVPAFANDPVQTALITEEKTIQPGQPFWVAIQLTVEKDWHAYWKNPGDSGMALDIEWQLPAGFVIDQIKWPYPQRFDLSSMVSYGYTGEVWLLARITAPASLPDQEVELSANVNWLVCSDEACLPGTSSATAKIGVSNAPPINNNNALHSSGFEKARSKIPSAKWQAAAQRKDGLIKLHLSSPSIPSIDPSLYNKVDFFPEHKNVIDPQIPALLVPPSDPSHNVTIILKDQGQGSRFLKGVVVLQTDSDTYPIEIDAPLDANDSNPVAYADPIKASSIQETDTTQFDGGIGLALILAFAGGLLLNLMPCVLPVISIKILSFVKMAGQSRSLTLKHGLAFSSGVIISFWILAGIMLVLQAYGRSVGWGFQLQEPLFVALLASLLLVFGLSLFGVFELGTSITNLASKAEGTFGFLGSFLNGVLATAVATPCTGPFLGSAIGFAVTLPPSLALLVFTSLGLGMASPYLLLAAYPHCMRFIPKPGQWMVVFKEIMGFLMLATVLWLLWVFGAQTSSLGVILLLSAFLFLSIGCWIYGTWGTPVKKRGTRLISYAAALLCFSVAGYVIVNTSQSPLVAAYDASASHKEEVVWQPFSASKVASLREQGIPVFVDFTAKWCLICQANHLVLTTPEVADKFTKMGVVLMKADWTKSDPMITEALRKFGRNGVPLYLMYGPNPHEQPTILPQVLTPDIVLRQLETVGQQIADRGS